MARPSNGLALAALLITSTGCAPADDPALLPDAAAPDAALIDAAIVDAAPPDAAPDAAPPPLPLAVGTFNIDWLADTYESEYTPRLAADYAMIAALIEETGVDVFGLQEIEGRGALELLGLPDDYAWAVGRSGWSQNPAILYRPDRVTLTDVREVHLPGTDFPSKDPLAARVTSLDGALAFTLVVVHMNPFPSTDDTTYRAHQITELHRWLTDGLDTAPPPAPPVVVLGDFNDTHEGIHRTLDTLTPLEGDPRFVFVEDDCPGGTEIHYESRIDHLIVDAALTDRLAEPACVLDRFDDRSPYADYPDGWRGRSNISSHRPLWMSLRVD
ncbi:MAG: endonuclease/exonuclease/phosphatase family protein [Myxococcales bacterium]|nr:endonuclease/exonuclease/phosphatase family protein [Myxococcales bacterium]